MIGQTNAGGFLPSTTLPIMDGTASVGTEQTYARGDHVHPTDTSRLGVNDTAANSYYLQDANTNAYKIQARYGGSGLTSAGEWIPIYNNMGNNIIELSPIHKNIMIQSAVREYNKDISWTLRADGGVYAYSFNTNSLFGIESKRIINIGMSYYSGSWRYLNFYPYGANDWVVISNSSSLSGRIKILYF